MQRQALIPILLLGLSSLAQAQGKDVLYYPFLTGTGTSVTNLWSGSGVAPKSGTLSTSNTTNQGWTKTGALGNALAGRDASSTYTLVDSGWTTPATGSLHSGSFTAAFFARESYDAGTGNHLANYFFSGIGSFRLFTGGVANEGFYLRAWGGTDLVLRGSPSGTTPYFDFRGEAKKRWVHVAIRVDESSDTATWFIDGTPIHNIPLAGAKTAITGTAGQTFKVNSHTSTGTSSNYDLDEFRFTGRAVPDHEIQAWAMAGLVADRTELSLSGTRTQALQLDLGSKHAVDRFWLFGSLTGTFPGTDVLGFKVPLNVDVYTTLLMGSVNTPVFQNFRGILDGQGRAKASFAPPANTPASAIGTDFFHAAVIYDFNGKWEMVSNAVRARIVK